MIAGVLSGRVYLKAEVTPADRIQKVKTDRKIFPKTGFHRPAENLTTFCINKIYGRHFKYDVVDVKKQAILFRYAVKTPAIIYLRRVKRKFFLHPLASPRRGIEERHNAKGRCSSLVHTCVKSLPVYHLGRAVHHGIQPKVDFIKNQALMLIQHAPVIE